MLSNEIVVSSSANFQCYFIMPYSGDDTDCNVSRLCHKAVRPLRSDLVESLGEWVRELSVASVCVYPSRVPEVAKQRQKTGGRYSICSGGNLKIE